jgi:hypothetical protein
VVKEIGWYLESGRFGRLAEEMEASLRNYESAKRAGQGEDALTELREEARALFEENCVRSGLRDREESFINIDAEFFSGNALDEPAMNAFINNVIKGHCFQKVLWTYMGTTGSFTVISRAEMANQGLRYDDYLPLEYRNNRRIKNPLEDRAGVGAEIFYMYGDGTVSKKYDAEKARLNFNTLEDRSGINWKESYDPNGSVRKDGWHGEFDYNGSWVRVEEKSGGYRRESYSGAVSIELIKNGDNAILYDPGMLLLSAPMITYLTEDGETYGSLAIDKEDTVRGIRETLGKMGVSKISAVGGITADKPELLSEYQALLGDTALPELRLADKESICEIKEERARAAAETANESLGTELERKLRTAGKYGCDSASVMSAVAKGSVSVPLSPRKISDGLALGLSEAEVNEINSIPVNPLYENEYDTILSNLFASWAYYEGGISRIEASKLVSEHLERGVTQDEPPVITGQASLGEIISGGKEAEADGVKTYASGIPGIFAESAVVDFYDGKAKEKYLKGLERKRVLPKGGAVSALAALEPLPAVSGEEKAELNRRLTRALGQYKAIAVSTGMPLKELIEAVKSSIGLGGEKTAGAALNRKVYYELPVESLVEEAKKENLQTKEVSLEDKAEREGESFVIIGGTQGPALDEVLLTREKLLESGFSEEEADKARSFLHGVRLNSSDPVISALLLETLNDGNVRTAGKLRQSVLGALNSSGAVSYNLSSEEGLDAYFESGRALESRISKHDIRMLLSEKTPRLASIHTEDILNVQPRYKAQGNIVPLNRSVPRGNPEKIYLKNDVREFHPSSSIISESVVPFETESVQTGGVYISPETLLPPDSTMKETGETDNSGYAMQSSGRQVYDTEQERMRKIEANYEKDKAVLSKEKQPALARSESHDVGHAGKIEDDEDLRKVLRLRQKELINELRREKGV